MKCNLFTLYFPFPLKFFCFNKYWLNIRLTTTHTISFIPPPPPHFFLSPSWASLVKCLCKDVDVDVYRALWRSRGAIELSSHPNLHSSRGVRLDMPPRAQVHGPPPRAFRTPMGTLAFRRWTTNPTRRPPPTTKHPTHLLWHHVVLIPATGQTNMKSVVINRSYMLVISVLVL